MENRKAVNIAEKFFYTNYWKWDRWLLCKKRLYKDLPINSWSVDVSVIKNTSSKQQIRIYIYIYIYILYIYIYMYIYIYIYVDNIYIHIYSYNTYLPSLPDLSGVSQFKKSSPCATFLVCFLPVSTEPLFFLCLHLNG